MAKQMCVELWQKQEKSLWQIGKKTFQTEALVGTFQSS